MKDITKPNLSELKKAFNGDLDLMLFYITWIKHNRIAYKAYMELYPNVDEHTARTLGSRKLAKVDMQLVMQAYGLDGDLYFNQLYDGIHAIKSDATGQTYPDHKVRKDYHDKLGKLLGIEKNEGVSINGEKVIAILGGVTMQNVSKDDGNNQNIDVK
jgi:hypothetical protein